MYDFRRPFDSCLKPSSANASVSGFAAVDTYDSRRCVKASMPLDAVMWEGQPIVSRGSTMATFGTKLLCRSDRLYPFSPVSEITAFFVASLPVPDVVGIAMNGILSPGCTDRPIPSRYSFTSRPNGNMAEIALPASNALPPPMATTHAKATVEYLLTARFTI